jgi:hypothetical protein
MQDIQKTAKHSDECKIYIQLKKILTIARYTDNCKKYRRLQGISMAAKYKVCDRNHFLSKLTMIKFKLVTFCIKFFNFNLSL